MKRKYNRKRVYLRNMRRENDRLKAENLLLSAKCNYFEEVIDFQSKAMQNIFTFVKYKIVRRRVYRILKSNIGDTTI